MNTNQEDQFLRCSEHREQPYQFLSLQRDNIQKKRLFCCKCLYSPEKEDWRSEFKELIPLYIVLESPEIMINKLTQGSYGRYLKAISNIQEIDLEKLFDEQISKFEQLAQKVLSMKEQLQEMLKEYKDKQEKLKNLRAEFLENISFNKFYELIHQLQQLNKQFKSDQYQQIEAKLINIIEEMMKNNCALIRESLQQTQQNHKNVINKQVNNSIQSVSKLKNEKIQSEIDSQFKQYEVFVDNLKKNFSLEVLEIAESNILSNPFFRTIQQKLELDGKKQINKTTLIYLGSRDGLNNNAFWSKINGKKNLLMIFQSKNNDYIFGGYSPCQWQQNLNNYVQDDTLCSFLFSQTKNEIYPLKQDRKQYAIYCHSSYCPVFGGGNAHDMYVNSDFTSGGESLGSNYSTEKYQISQYHLFGGSTPNIKECEIYELIFE